MVKRELLSKEDIEKLQHNLQCQEDGRYIKRSFVTYDSNGKAIANTSKQAKVLHYGE